MSLLFFSSTTRAAVVNEKGFFCLSAVNSGVWHVYGPRSVLQMQCTALLLCARKTQASQAPRWRYYKLRFGNLFKIEQMAKCWFSRNGFSWSSKKILLKFEKISLKRESLQRDYLETDSQDMSCLETDSLKRILSNGFSQNGFSQNRFSWNDFSQKGFSQKGISQKIFSRNRFSQRDSLKRNSLKRDSFERDSLKIWKKDLSRSLKRVLSKGVLLKQETHYQDMSFLKTDSLKQILKNGFSQNGFSQNGLSRFWLSQNGFSQKRLSRNGFSWNGFSRKIFGTDFLDSDSLNSIVFWLGQCILFELNIFPWPSLWR